MADDSAAPPINVSDVVQVKGREFRIEGYVAPGYEPVADQFRENFARGREIGAATAAYLGDRPVVDLWGGYRSVDHIQPWERDTTVLLLSTTKGLSAMTAAVAHSRGWLDFDAPVASYWPEFAQNGKADITVRQLLAHQAGVCVFDTPLTLDLITSRDQLDDVLARQAPAWTPGERHGYHVVVLGWYQDALLRRVDPGGRSLGTLLQDEIASPLGLDMFIGLLESADERRRAEVHVTRAWGSMREWPLALTAAMFNPRSLPMRMAAASPTRNQEDLNTRPYLQPEIPSANGVASARAVARAYAEFASGAPALRIDPQTIRELEAPASAPSSSTIDAFYCFETAYALGFSKRAPRLPLGSSTAAYGAPGAGGSQGFADPELGLGFAYTPNKLDIGVYDDPRAAAIRARLYECLGSQAVR